MLLRMKVWCYDSLGMEQRDRERERGRWAKSDDIHADRAERKKYILSVINSLWKNFKFENDAKCVKANQFFGQNSFIIKKN